jgi:hypothetical protein
VTDVALLLVALEDFAELLLVVPAPPLPGPPMIVTEFPHAQRSSAAIAVRITKEERMAMAQHAGEQGPAHGVHRQL